MAFNVAGGWVGKRRFRKAASGSRIPDIANILKKKNSQRGQRVGKAAMNRYVTPAQPIKARMIAAGSVERTDGDDIIFREVVNMGRFYHSSSKLYTKSKEVLRIFLFVKKINTIQVFFEFEESS
jgi:hypothetical protein